VVSLKISFKPSILLSSLSTRLAAGRQAQVAEDLADHRRIFDGGGRAMADHAPFLGRARGVSLRHRSHTSAPRSRRRTTTTNATAPSSTASGTNSLPGDSGLWNQLLETGTQ